MSARSDETRGGVSFLHSVRHVFDKGNPHPGEAELLDRLGAIERGLADLAERIPEAPAGGAPAGTVDAPPELVVIRDAVAALEKQVGKAGREQFKTNSLRESEQEQLAGALQSLRANETRLTDDLAALRAAQGAAQAAARLDVVQAILPALDGLDEALRTGRHLLEPRPVAGALAHRPASLLERMRAARALQVPAVSPAVSGLRDSLAAWLVGLTFVRGRLLDVLAAEGVRPMEAEGRPFDSTRHVALEVVPVSAAAPPGTVTAELRRGYLVGDRILRYAEVAVSR